MSSSGATACEVLPISDLRDFLKLLQNISCHRYSPAFTVFLIVANIIIFFIGLIGNFLVAYVAIIKLKAKTASTVFIVNLAAADLLVILCCIPANLFSNLFIRKFWTNPTASDTVQVLKYITNIFNIFSVDIWRLHMQTGCICSGCVCVLLCIFLGGDFIWSVIIILVLIVSTSLHQS